VDIAAKYPGTGDNSEGGYVIFDPKQYKERAGLLLVNHILYTSWASHCDIRPYTGWIISYNETTLAQQSVLNVTPHGNEGSIWAAERDRRRTRTEIFTSRCEWNVRYDADANGFPIMAITGTRS